jgi:hypothetical protein
MPLDYFSCMNYPRGLNMWSHAYDMRERKVLSENEWNGWLYWMSI